MKVEQVVSFDELLNNVDHYTVKGTINQDQSHSFFQWVIDLLRGERREGVVFFNSMGGSVDYGLSMYDQVRMAIRLGLRLTAVTVNPIASSAINLFMAFDRRLVAERTTAFIHPLQVSVSEMHDMATMQSLDKVQVSAVMSSLKLTQAAESSEQMIQLFMLRCGWSRKQTIKRLQSESMYIGHEIIKVGIATGLVI